MDAESRGWVAPMTKEPLPALLAPHASLDFGLRCVGPSDEGGGWERHAHLTIATDDTRAGKLLVPLTLEVQLPRLRVEPRELLVAMDGTWEGVTHEDITLYNDGDADLYVANDFGRNNLYRNEGGKFTDVAAEAGVEDGAFGMSVSWGDYNHDGLMDIYVANMFSAAGNRVTYQRRFKPQATGEAKSRLQHTARGNTLFENRGDGTFRDVSADAGVTMGRWGWASLFADINNDRWEDLVLSNGYFTGSDPNDL